MNIIKNINKIKDIKVYLSIIPIILIIVFLFYSNYKINNQIKNNNNHKINIKQKELFNNSKNNEINNKINNEINNLVDIPLDKAVGNVGKILEIKHTIKDRQPLTDLEFRTLIDPKENPINIKNMTNSSRKYFIRDERLTDYSDLVI